MVIQGFDTVIKDFLGYFEAKVKELSFNNSIPVVTLQNSKKTLRGLRNVVSEISNLNDIELATVQDQLSEYIQTHSGVFHNVDTMKELDNYLVDKMYFVGNTLGAIDILIYYLLYNIFLCLSLQEKEKYINISRWFDEVQQNEKARVSRLVVPFSRCCLYN